MALAAGHHGNQDAAAPGSDAEYGHDDNDDDLLADILDDIEDHSRPTSFGPSVVESVEEHAASPSTGLCQDSNAPRYPAQEDYVFGFSLARGPAVQIELDFPECASIAGILRPWTHVICQTD